MRKYYAIVFHYHKISRNQYSHKKIARQILVYFKKNKELGFELKKTYSPEDVFSSNNPDDMFSLGDLRDLMFWLHQHPRVVLMIDALASVGKLRNSKNVKDSEGYRINKYECANLVMHCQTLAFSHAWHHIIECIPKSCHVNTLSAIRSNLKPVKKSR